MTDVRAEPRESRLSPGIRRAVRIALLVGGVVLALTAIWWRGPDWGVVRSAIELAIWRWIAFAFVLNLFSCLFRALSWRLTISQALPPPQPRYADVLSAFGVGLFANTVLPGRLGELARVATLRRHMPQGQGTSATLLGTVFAHRLFDLVPATLLVVWVLFTARVPHWAVTSFLIAGAIGFALFAVALLGARRHDRSVMREGMGTFGRLLAMARQGLSVLNAPLVALGAIALQCLGWLMQLLAVFVAMRGFGIDAPLPAAGLVLVLMNVATIFPLWPGNVGLVQAAVALPLRAYGVPYAIGFAYGIVLQLLEMSVGVGLGLVAFGHEGVSLATLRRFSDEEEQDSEENVVEEVHELIEELDHASGAPLPR